MLTEKAIKDHVWCQMLWREVAGNPKRYKDDRRGGDDTITQIHTALTTGTPTKKAYLEKLEYGRVARPFTDQFWTVVMTDYVQLLLTINSVRVEKIGDDPWKVTVIRERGSKPRSDDFLHAEEMVRRILVREFQETFPKQTVTVISVYEHESYILKEPSESELIEADQFFEDIRCTADGESPYVARTDRCEVCWWKACPARIPEKGMVSTGKPRKLAL